MKEVSTAVIDDYNIDLTARMVSCAGEIGNIVCDRHCVFFLMYENLSLHSKLIPLQAHMKTAKVGHKSTVTLRISNAKTSTLYQEICYNVHVLTKILQPTNEIKSSTKETTSLFFFLHFLACLNLVGKTTIA